MTGEVQWATSDLVLVREAFAEALRRFPSDPAGVLTFLWYASGIATEPLIENDMMRTSDEVEKIIGEAWP